MCDQLCFSKLKIWIILKYVLSIFKYTLFCHRVLTQVLSLIHCLIWKILFINRGGGGGNNLVCPGGTNLNCTSAQTLFWLKKFSMYTTDTCFTESQLYSSTRRYNFFFRKQQKKSRAFITLKWQRNYDKIHNTPKSNLDGNGLL